MQRLFLLDAHGLAYRAFFAMKTLSTSTGIPTNAVYGFINMFLKLIREEKPNYLAVVFDSGVPTFRHQKYPQYKAQRKKMPDEMKQQIPIIMEVISAFNIPVFLMDGYEADDIIGTLVKKFENEVDEIIVVSADKDILQLVTDKIKVLATKKGLSETVLYDIEGVKGKFGVPPDKVIDVLGLCGDTSDNIPGIKGIGEKTAIELIQEFGSFEVLLNNLDKVSNEKRREIIKTYLTDAILSKELVTIDTNVPITADLEECRVKEYNKDRLFEILEKLEFKKFLKDLGLYKKLEGSKECDYRIITEEKGFQALINLLSNTSSLAIELVTTSINPLQAEIVGIAISTKPHSAWYIPMAHEYLGVPEQLPQEYVLKALKPFLESKDIKKIGHNLKYQLLVLANPGCHGEIVEPPFDRLRVTSCHGELIEPCIRVKGIAFDAMLASYLLNPTAKHNLEDIILNYYGIDKSCVGSQGSIARGATSSSTMNIQQAGDCACSDVDFIYRVSCEVLKPKLNEASLITLFEDVEMPVTEVLAQMELDGIKIDIPYLKGLSQEFGQKLNDLSAEIYKLADTEFNINSPKQLGFILFEKLKMPVIKKIKTGFSTDEEVLIKLSAYHPLPDKLLAYRELTKLKSTYVDALLELADPTTHRLHTSYNQTIAATGRLTSSNPNLQNIPIRTDLGNRIREAFIPEEGCILLSADYSQIELRLLAHISKDERLIAAFINDEDIHTQTALEIFGGSPELITSEMRRAAKVVNFGITYGMSAYGLSKELRITPGQSKDMIERYFERYPGVKGYIDKTISEAKLKGFVSTLWGRKRYLPEINSSNRTLREFAERQAVNMPIQGTAADLIKMAMIEIHKRLDRKKAKMLLQVHDELVFEVKEDSLNEVVELVKECMEGIANFLVPIKVDIHSGENWGKI
ncbi:MAG: DNA polymerase I [Nitrospirota bacterium]